MDRQLREIVGDDQFSAERREGRRLAVAIAEDVVAYHNTLTAGGLDGELIATLTEQFATHWLGPVTSDAQIVFSVNGMEGDD